MPCAAARLGVSAGSELQRATELKIFERIAQLTQQAHGSPAAAAAAAATAHADSDAAAAAAAAAAADKGAGTQPPRVVCMPF